LKNKIFIINVLIIASIFIVIVQDWIKMNKSRNDIDNLNKSLLQIKNILPDNSSLSFLTNLNDEMSTELFYKTQFVLVPRIIIKKDLKADTFLIIDDPSVQNKTIIRNEIALYTDKSNLYNIKLVRSYK
jgi:hypothetical protein